MGDRDGLFSFDDDNKCGNATGMNAIFLGLETECDVLFREWICSVESIWMNAIHCSFEQKGILAGCGAVSCSAAGIRVTMVMGD